MPPPPRGKTFYVEYFPKNVCFTLVFWCLPSNTLLCYLTAGSGGGNINKCVCVVTTMFDITKNVPKYESLVWLHEFWHKLFNIFRPGAYFSNTIFALNRELKPVVLSTMKPINETDNFLPYKGVQANL